MRTRTLARLLALAALSTLGCGSNDDDDGSEGNGGNEGTCDLALTLEGDYPFHSELDDSMTCISTIGSGLGADWAVAPTRNDVLTVADFSLSTLEAGATAEDLPLSLLLTFANNGRFAPTQCTASVTQNSFVEMDEFASRYHVVGDGSCAMPAVAGGETVSVVGFFRFVATIGWSN